MGVKTSIHTHSHRHTDTQPHECTHNTELTISNVYRNSNTHTQHESLYPEAVQCQTPHPELQLCQLFTHSYTHSYLLTGSVCVSAHVHFTVCVCACVRALYCLSPYFSSLSVRLCLRVCGNGHTLARQDKQKASLFHPRHVCFIFFSYKQARGRGG